MIGRLAVAQLRAHRVQSAWTLGLLTLLAAIVTAMLAIGATEQQVRAQASSLMGYDREFVGGTDLLVAGEADGLAGIPVAEFAAELDRLPDAVANAGGNLSVREIEEGEDFEAGESPYVVALSNPADANAFVTQGRAPARLGEIAVTPELAKRLDAQIGTDVTLYNASIYGPTLEQRTFTVVGMITSATQPPAEDLWLPDALVSWDEATTADGVLTFAGPEDTILSNVTVQLDGHSALLDGYLSSWGNNSTDDGLLSYPTSAGAWYAGAIALVVSMVIMSFAVGRSQAASRTQWVGTARVLGASARYVAFATIVETLLLAGIAAVAGLLLGLTAAQGYLTWSRSHVGSPLGSERIAVGTVTVPIVAGVVLAVALIVAAVPAFWAARVPPAAALKPVNDVTEAQISRDVAIAWVWLPLVGCMVGIYLGSRYDTPSMAVVAAIGSVGALITAFALWLEGLRRVIPRIGARMSRSEHAATMLAGDALRLRPRQSVAPAAIVGIAAALGALTCGGSATDLAWALSDRGADSAWGLSTGLRQWGEQLTTPGFTGTSLAVLAVILVVLAAIGVAHRASIARELGVLRALGASRSAVRAAFVRQWLAAQALGAVAGIVAGTVMYLAVLAITLAAHNGFRSLTRMGIDPDRESLEPYLWQALLGALGAAMLAVVFLAASALAARLVASRTTPAMPAGSLASES